MINKPKNLKLILIISVILIIFGAGVLSGQLIFDRKDTSQSLDSNTPIKKNDIEAEVNNIEETLNNIEPNDFSENELSDENLGLTSE